MFVGEGSESLVALSDWMAGCLYVELDFLGVTLVAMRHQIGFDVMMIGESIYAALGELNAAQCALIGDLVDFKRAASLEEVEEYSKEYSKRFSHVATQFGSLPTVRLTLLRMVDQIWVSNAAEGYYKFLRRITKRLIDLGPKRNSTETSALLDQIDVVLRQAATGLVANVDTDFTRRVAAINSHMARLKYAALKNLLMSERFPILTSRERSIEVMLQRLCIDIVQLNEGSAKDRTALLADMAPSLGIYGTLDERLSSVQKLIDANKSPNYDEKQALSVVKMAAAIDADRPLSFEVKPASIQLCKAIIDLLFIGFQQRLTPSEIAWRDNFLETLRKVGSSHQDPKGVSGSARSVGNDANIVPPNLPSVSDTTGGLDVPDSLDEPSASSNVKKAPGIPNEPNAPNAPNITNRSTGPNTARSPIPKTPKRSGGAPPKPSPSLASTPRVKSMNNKTPVDAELKEALQSLEKLVGLASVKADVKQIASFAKVQQARKKAGLPVVTSTNHLIFAGNPGTGKTTVGRLLGRIYKGLGVLSKGHLVEVDRAGLVAPYEGQTALKVEKVFQSAKGGVLFIDEAYGVVRAENDDFGEEAINAVTKLMEDNRSDLVVIAAGYPKEMTEFLERNQGLNSRFTKTITFEDYLPDELMEIFISLCNSQHYSVGAEAYHAMEDIMATVYRNKDKTFGNARTVRNIFQKAIEHQAQRIADGTSDGSITEQLKHYPRLLTELMKSDFSEPVNFKPPK